MIAWCIYRVCFRAGDGFDASGSCLSDNVCRCAGQASLVGNAVSQPNATVESDLTVLIFSVIPVPLAELGKHQTPAQKILYLSLNLGWRSLQPATLHKVLCSSRVRFSIIEKGSHFLFFKCSKDGSQSLRNPKKGSVFS